MDLEKIKKLNIPKSPGCYLYKNKEGEIIYVGKAANLRSRVLSYLPAMQAEARQAGWREQFGLSPAKFAMLKEIQSVEWIITDSEIEALLLEANLIKKYQPSFNVIMRDDKRYAYIKISLEEEWPRIFLTRNLDHSGRFFGPFTSVDAVRDVLKIIRKIWPYRSCSHLPKRACLYYRINKCPGMCETKIEKEEYKKIIKQIILFLEGKKGKVISNLKSLISDYEIKLKNKSIKQEEKDSLFLKINLLKYQIVNIKKILEGANVLSVIDKYAADVVELAKVLNLPRVPERIEGYDISNIFGQAAVGSMVVFSGGEPYKNEYRKFKIKISVGEANDVLMLREVLERRFNHITRNTKHVTKDDTVRNRETCLSGRQARKQKTAIWALPDLVILDGGKGQLNIASAVIKKFKLNIPVLAISKGGGLRSAIAPDKIFFPGEKKPLILPLASPALHILKRVRDEAHRFAVGYHRLLRSKKFIQ